MKKIENYIDFVRAFDNMDNWSLMDARKSNPAIRLSEFREAHPDKYNEYRQQMHREHIRNHCAEYNDKDNSNNEGLLNSFRNLPI